MRPDWKARAASTRAGGLGILPTGSVGIATAEALCAARPGPSSPDNNPIPTTREALAGYAGTDKLHVIAAYYRYTQDS